MSSQHLLPSFIQASKLVAFFLWDGKWVKGRAGGLHHPDNSQAACLSLSVLRITGIRKEGEQERINPSSSPLNQTSASQQAPCFTLTKILYIQTKGRQ